MAQEYFINSQELEDKIRDLLPSQGGAGAGVDLSASTQIIPIIDLTESAEGSNVRQDLQTALSFNSVTAFNVANQTTTLINNTGYFRVFGATSLEAFTGQVLGRFTLTDGASSKIIYEATMDATGSIVENTFVNFDFIVFLAAGDSLTATTNDSKAVIAGCSRQIADITGTLVNPT